MHFLCHCFEIWSNVKKHIWSVKTSGCSRPQRCPKETSGRPRSTHGDLEYEPYRLKLKLFHSDANDTSSHLYAEIF